MRRRRFTWLYGAAVVGMFMQSANAAPMRCADLKSACVAACSKGPVAIRGACLSNCNTRQVNCQQSGCWNEGGNNLCGLQRR